jgi:hypothetical protein
VQASAPVHRIREEWGAKAVPLPADLVANVVDLPQEPEIAGTSAALLVAVIYQP